jgi:hypothetical protein
MHCDEQAAMNDNKGAPDNNAGIYFPGPGQKQAVNTLTPCF